MAGKRGNGEGSIRHRPDGRWEARYCVTENGRRLRRCVYGKTRQEANAALRARLAAVDRGMPDRASAETVAAFLAAWFEGARPSLKPPSQRRYRQALDTHIIPALGRHRLRDLRPDHVQRLYSAMLDQGLSANTARVVHFVLHRALAQALRWGRVHRNVADMVDIPRLSHTIPQALDTEQARAVIHAARGDRLEALVMLAVTKGLRRGELIALTWGSVDLDGGRLEISGTMQPTEAGYVVAEPKSASSRRTVGLAPVLVESLRRHRARQATEHLAAGPLWHASSHVFTTELGQPVPPMRIGRLWGRLLSDSGIPHMKFHAARATAATLMDAAGVNPLVAAVEALLGDA